VKSLSGPTGRSYVSPGQRPGNRIPKQSPKPQFAGCTVNDYVESPQAIDTDTELPAASEFVIAEIDGQDIILNGSRLTLPVSVGKIEDILGSANRSSQEYGGTITWDDLGLFCRVTSGKVHELVFVFQEYQKPLGFCPKNSFAGVISMGGVSLNGNSKWDEVERAGMKKSPLGLWENRSSFTMESNGSIQFLGFANPISSKP
jgi:hypothetical protein